MNKENGIQYVQNSSIYGNDLSVNGGGRIIQVAKTFRSGYLLRSKKCYIIKETVASDSCNGFHNGHSSVKIRDVSFSAKIFCDPVHGQMPLHPACVAIIDTPQFQRLRYIKQTGFVDHVYPGSVHNRFAHSLGVSYLARKFLLDLKERQPELNISDTDILCVELAGLCHDLGHGPYSHTWELFMKAANLQRNICKSWKHENVSINMLDYLIKENNLLPVFAEYGIGLPEVKLVKDYIMGSKPKDGKKAFLYQIVNNDDSGLDVDKWDYFLRDCLFLGIPCSFEYERLMQFAKVFTVDGRTQICFRDKVLESVCNVFRTRSNLHRLAYQHKIVTIIDRMFIDAILHVDDKITGPNGEILHLWEWSTCAAYSEGQELWTALEKFSLLTDSLIYMSMKHTTKPDLLKASQLIKSIETRSSKDSSCYQHVGLKILSHMCREPEILHGISQYLPAANENVMETYISGHLTDEVFNPVTIKDICICVTSVNWGKGSNNPINYVHFYTKQQPWMSSSLDHLEVSVMLPSTFEEIQVHVLSRRNDIYAVQVIRWCFEKYWNHSLDKNSSHL